MIIESIADIRGQWFTDSIGNDTNRTQRYNCRPNTGKRRQLALRPRWEPSVTPLSLQCWSQTASFLSIGPLHPKSRCIPFLGTPFVRMVFEDMFPRKTSKICGLASVRVRHITAVNATAKITFLLDNILEKSLVISLWKWTISMNQELLFQRLLINIADKNFYCTIVYYLPQFIASCLRICLSGAGK